MLFILYIFFLVVNVAASFSKNNVKILDYITAIFILIFVTGKRYVGGYIAYDLIHYEENYGLKDDMFEVGFQFVRDIAISNGLSFNSFYMLLTGICLISIYCIIKKRHGNIHLFYVAYLIYYILIPIDQLKNLCAFTIFLYSLKWIKPFKWAHIVMYVGGVLFASLFHPSYILYLLLLLVYVKPVFNHTKAISLSFISLTALAVILGLQSMISSQLSLFMAVMNSYDRYDKYFESISRNAPLAIITVFITVVFMMYYWRKHFVKKGINVNKSNLVTLDEANIILAFVLLNGLFLPMLIMSMTTYRYIRDISLIAIIFCSVNANRNNNIRDKLMLLSFVIAISVGMFIYDIVLNGYWEDYKLYFFTNDFLKNIL